MTAAVQSEVLAEFRGRIDAVDRAMVDLLAERIRIVGEVIAAKQQHGIAARLDDRVEAVVANVRRLAAERDCPPDLAEHLWRTMIDWVIGYEERHLAAAPAKPEQD